MKNICDLYDKEFTDLPEKVLQFGDGNFLRAFADWYIQKADEAEIFNGRVVIAQPTPHGRADEINEQNSFYTVAVRGAENSKPVETFDKISCVSRCINPYKNYTVLADVAVSEHLEVIISNTTEAGIAYKSGERQSDVPNVTYPAMLTDLLFRRFSAGRQGVLVLPVELIENNADVLKAYVLRYADDWRLGDKFKNYINNECKFCCTLVDRIVTGFPADDYSKICRRLGYEDNFITVCEPYNSWLIQGDEECADIFPLHKAGLNIRWCDDLSPYRERKVRILNGAHTMSVCSAYLCGFNIVRDMVSDPLFSAYIRKGLFEEVMPTLNLPEKELVDFAESVLERFSNPFIDHKLLDISLNSVSKYKSRCLPAMLDYIKITGKLPCVLCFALASLIVFYNGKYSKEDNLFYGERNGKTYRINDSKEVTDYFEFAYSQNDTVKAVLKNKDFWNTDLTEIDGIYDLVKKYFDDINNSSMKEAVEKVLGYEQTF